MNEHKYTILEESEDPKASTIRKSNVNVDFSLYDLEKNERDFRKLLKELTAQKSLADAKMTNIETNHPYVQDLTEEQAFTVHMYQEARSMSRVCGQKIPEIEAELKYIEEEKTEIAKQVGIAIPVSALADAPSDRVVPEEAPKVEPTAPVEGEVKENTDANKEENTNEDKGNA